MTMLRRRRSSGGPKLFLPVEAMAEAYRKGASLKDLAAEYGASAETIRKRLKAHGVVFRVPVAGARFIRKAADP